MTPFLLIPGLNCDARVFAGIANTLWPYGPVTIANQQRHDTMAELAAAILESAPQSFALLGFSMGGYIAFEILRQAPERVTKLALLDTSARADTPEAIENRRRRIALAQSGKMSAVTDQSFPATVHPDNESNSDLYALHRAMAEANGPEVYVRQQEAIIGRSDSVPMLGDIRVPTLVLVGEGDTITPPEHAEEMHRGIAGSRLVKVPRAGHLALLEQPEPVQAAIREWAES
jgi:pimeloyl-ACP methyl ester carboxylesterase